MILRYRANPVRKLAASSLIAVLLAAMPGMPALAGGLRSAAAKTGPTGLPTRAPGLQVIPAGFSAQWASPGTASPAAMGLAASAQAPHLPGTVLPAVELAAEASLSDGGSPAQAPRPPRRVPALSSLGGADAEPGKVLAAAGALFDNARLKPGTAKNPEVAVLKYAAASFATGLVTLRRNIEAVETLGLNPLDMTAQVRLVVADSMDNIRQAAAGKLEPRVQRFAREITAALERLSPQALDDKKALADWKSDIDRLVSLLLALSHSREKDSENFVLAATLRLGSLDAEKATPRSGSFGLGSLAVLAMAFLYALASATFWPLPAEFHWGSLWSLSPPQGFFLEALRWAVINVGLALLSLMSKEKFNQYYNPLNLEAKPLARLVPYLFIAAGIEEVIFRSMLLGSIAFALTLISVPALPAMALATVTSSLIFARVHGYGPKMARLFGGLVFGYLALAHGLLMATMVHFLSNLILVLFSKIHDALKKHVAAPPAPA